MTTPQPTLTAAFGGRLSGRPLHSPVLQSFTRLEAGEGRSLLLFFAYAFLVLVFYYIVRTLREPLLLVGWVTAFFIATLGALFLAKRGGADIGFVYYVWAGIFGVTIVAQFWAHAADCFDVATGRRLFPAIMMGATLGGIVGPSVY